MAIDGQYIAKAVHISHFTVKGTRCVNAKPPQMGHSRGGCLEAATPQTKHLAVSKAAQVEPSWHLDIPDTCTYFAAGLVQHMLAVSSSNDPSGKQMMGHICRQFNGRGLG